MSPLSLPLPLMVLGRWTAVFPRPSLPCPDTHWRSAAPAAAPLLRIGHTNRGRPAAPIRQSCAPRLAPPGRGDPAAVRRCSARRGAGAPQAASAVSAADQAGEGERVGRPGVEDRGLPGQPSGRRAPRAPRARWRGARGRSGARSGWGAAAAAAIPGRSGSADNAAVRGPRVAGRGAARWPGTPWPCLASGGGGGSRCG